LVAYDRDLRRGTVLHDVEQGHDARAGEIHIFLLLAGFVDGQPERERDELQIGQQALVVRCRERVEKMILLWGVRCRHRAWIPIFRLEQARVAAIRSRPETDIRLVQCPRAGMYATAQRGDFSRNSVGGPHLRRSVSLTQFCQSVICFSTASLVMPYVSWILPASWSR